MANTEDLLLCTACGTQFDIEDRGLLKSCQICDDPRQHVPRTGQTFTTLGELRRTGYKNNWEAFDGDDRFWSIWTEPKFGIGQRAILIRTPQGNVLWDCVAYIDEETVDWIKSLGGLSAIVISHPHYYSTHLEWAKAFGCPVHLASEDKEWLNRLDSTGKSRTFIQSKVSQLQLSGQTSPITILKVGGHFPGSLLVLAYDRLLIADTLVTTPSGLGDWSITPPPAHAQAARDENQTSSPSVNTGTGTVAALAAPDQPKGKRPPGLNTYAFMYSIPNMIPLKPIEIAGIWDVLKEHHFTSTHGAFTGVDVSDGYGGSERSVKGRVLDSMQIQVRNMGWEEHEFLMVKWD